MKEKKKNSIVDISESYRCRCEHDTIDIPQEDNNSGQKLNGDEFIEFDGKIDGITDQPYGIKLISIACHTSPCIWPYAQYVEVVCTSTGGPGPNQVNKRIHLHYSQQLHPQ